MLETLKNIIKKLKPGFLAASVILSFGLWFIRANLTDPMSYESLWLSLRLLNEDVLTENSRLIQNPRELQNVRVRVNVTGPESQLSLLHENDTIYAYIDLDSSELVYISNARLGQPMPVRIGIGFGEAVNPESYSITSISPELTDIILDRNARKPVNVTVYRNGTPPAGYVAGDTEQEPRSIDVAGPYSVISKIDTLGVEVDLSQARDDIEEVSVLRAYDLDHLVVDLTGVEMESREVHFKIPVYTESAVDIA
ncbi:MAG: hypothetical protein LBS19_00995, partial [Clostridiales bacterium]|nr:hypothetical protein [Clostridiales bacterium]